MTFSTVRLGEIAEFINGKAFGPSDWSDEGRRIIRIQNLTTPEKPYNRTTVDVDEKYHVHQGELLVSWSASLGVYEWPGPDTGLVNQHIFRVVPDLSKVDKDYLRRALSRALSAMERYVHGSTMRHVNRKEFLSTKIRLPPLPEQQRIAAILDKADAVRRKRQQTFDLADQFLRSAFLDLFGDPVTNPKGWPIKKLGEVAKITTGNTPSRKRPEYFGPGIEWIKSDNINTPGHFLTRAEESLSLAGGGNARIVEGGATLMTCIAGSRSCIGNVALADREVAFNQQINAITPGEELESDFLYGELLYAKKLIQAASTNSMKGLVSKGRLSRVATPVPPLELQKRFSHLFRETLRGANHLAGAQAEASALFSSLTQRAFRGEL